MVSCHRIVYTFQMSFLKRARKKTIPVLLLVLVVTACAGPGSVYHDPNMDFASIQTVAVMPLQNLTRDPQAADRVRDVFMTRLLSTGSIYVVPPGEVARGISVTGVTNPTMPTAEEIKKLVSAIKADAVITGVLREYGETRSGSAMANVISLSVQMNEGQTGKVVWSASTTKGGIGLRERLLGGGGEPLNDVTEKAVDDLIKRLFQ